MRPRRDAFVAASVVASIAVLALRPYVAGAQQPTVLPAGAPPPAAVPPATAPAGALGTVSGVVYDSLTHGPLAGATVQSVRAGDLLGGRSVAADSLGAFRIDSLAPGRYLVGFSHPLLDLLRIEVAPRLVELGSGGDAVRVDLGVPSLDRVRPAVCGTPEAPSDSAGLLVGRVRDASDDALVAHATVVLTWSELSVGTRGLHMAHRRVPVPTGPGGTYVACGVPSGVELAVTAAAPGRASGAVELELPTRGFVVRDLTLGDTVSVAAATTAPPGGATARPGAGDTTTTAPVARGTARLTGTVRDPAGHPVRGARAFVWGTAAATTADEEGAFALGGLPAGTRTLEVRAVGFAPHRVPVDLAAGRARTLDVRLDRTVATLTPVTVFGTPSSPSRQFREFLDRQSHRSFGRFLTAADIQRWQPIDVTGALRAVPGVRVAPNGRLGSTILVRGKFGGSCRPAVVLNGAFLLPDDDIDELVSPDQVAGIEVYIDPAYAPPEYSGTQMNGCGVVLVWTR